MACEIVWYKKGVHLKYSGKLNLTEILEVGNNLLSDWRYDDCIFEVSDFTHITEYVINKQDVKVIATLDKTASNFVHLKYVVVVHNNPEANELSNIYLASMDDIGIKTAHVEDFESAINYLKENNIAMD